MNFPDFFRRQQVNAMTMQELFNFVTDININQDNIDCYLENAMAIACERDPNEVIDEQVGT